MFKIIDSTYAKKDLKQAVDNAPQLDTEERTQLLSLFKDFEGFFDGNLVYWPTEPVDLDLKPVSKSFNSRYYPVPRIKKKNCFKNIKVLV